MSSLSYIAILGRQPELGLAELESLLGPDRMQPFGRQAALVGRELNVSRLGGVLKAGRILYDGPVTDLRLLPVEAARLPVGEGKTPFAVSVYGSKTNRRAVEAAGLSLKKQLRERGPVRLVTPGEGMVVSAAQLRHNNVLERGFELLVVVSGRRMVVARTTGVQDIDWYSKRDYERPARSAKVGMLPPKLAQVLINTTSSGIVADPFCGTGVVPAEALLMGRGAWASDMAPEMVRATRTNLAWLAKQPKASAPLPDWRVENAADARTVQLPGGCVVVSEGYLGPNLAHSPTPVELEKIQSKLLALYRDSLASWARQLPGGAEVSLCVPAWRVGKRWRYLGLVDELSHLGYTLKGFKHVQSPLLYAREDQLVGRQLLFLRKK